jgi:hypothetical protein
VTVAVLDEDVVNSPTVGDIEAVEETQVVLVEDMHCVLVEVVVPVGVTEAQDVGVEVAEWVLLALVVEVDVAVTAKTVADDVWERECVEVGEAVEEAERHKEAVGVEVPVEFTERLGVGVEEAEKVLFKHGVEVEVTEGVGDTLLLTEREDVVVSHRDRVPEAELDRVPETVAQELLEDARVAVWDWHPVELRVTREDPVLSDVTLEVKLGEAVEDEHAQLVGVTLGLELEVVDEDCVKRVDPVLLSVPLAVKLGEAVEDELVVVDEDCVIRVDPVLLDVTLAVMLGVAVDDEHAQLVGVVLELELVVVEAERQPVAVTVAEPLTVVLPLRVICPSTPAKPRHTNRISNKKKFIALAVTLSMT